MEVDMTSVRKLVATCATTALIGVGALVASASSASAYTVCNRWGECWNERVRYDYPYSLGVRYYDDDNWYWRHRHNGWRHHYWRHHHDGRGYWRSGIWIRF
jgi:hypothetical protein